MPTSKAEVQEWRKEIAESARDEIQNTQKSLAENFRIAIDKNEFTIDDIKGLMSDDSTLGKKSYRKCSLAFHPDKAAGKGLDPTLYTMFVSYNEYHKNPTTDDLGILSSGIKAEIILEKALATLENRSDISLDQDAGQNAAKDAELLRALDEKFQKEAEQKEAQERADADMARKLYEQEKTQEALRIAKQKKAEQERRDAMLAKAIADELAIQDYERSKEQAREEEQNARKAQELAEEELAADQKVKVEEIVEPEEEVHMHMPPNVEPEIDLAEEQAKADQKAQEEARNWQATMDLLAQEEAEERERERQRRNNP